MPVPCSIYHTWPMILISSEKISVVRPFHPSYPSELWLIDFGPLVASQANISCEGICDFWAAIPTATESIATIRHTRKLSASQLKKLTDRPCSTLPDPICNLSAGKHAGGAKGGRAFYLVLQHQPLLSMLYLGSFHPPADRRVYIGPSVKDLRHSHPESFPLCSPHRLRGRSDCQGQQDRELWCSKRVCMCMTAWLLLPARVHTLMQDLSITLCTTYTYRAQQGKSTISSQRGCATMR